MRQCARSLSVMSCPDVQSTSLPTATSRCSFRQARASLPMARHPTDPARVPVPIPKESTGQTGVPNRGSSNRRNTPVRCHLANTSPNSSRDENGSWHGPDGITTPGERGPTLDDCPLLDLDAWQIGRQICCRIVSIRRMDRTRRRTVFSRTELPRRVAKGLPECTGKMRRSRKPGCQSDLGQAQGRMPQ